MELGAENKKKVGLAIGLVVALVLVLAWEFLGSSSTPAGSSAAANVAGVRPTQRRPSSKAGKRAAAAEARLDPTLDLTLLAATEQTKYAGNGRNIFVAGADIPQPLAPGVKDKQKAQQQWTPPTTPPPPPITLKFFGFASKPGEPKKIFLSQGEDVFIAAEGDIVNRRYKVLRISPTAVDIEDVLYNNRQSIPLTQS